ncbi:MAG: DUF1284 domain-containing protein [Methanobacterium sp.]|nr:DUF1284 domain-containing protein [Methanobacterium sp.]
MEDQSIGFSDVIKIRAHHLLCIQGFQGYGYSPEFQINLEKVIKFLKNHPNSCLKVVAEADVICESCPNLEGGCCNRYLHSNSIQSMDIQVLKKLGIADGHIEQVGSLFSQVKDALNKVEDVKDICGNCSWKDKCLWYLSLGL